MLRALVAAFRSSWAAGLTSKYDFIKASYFALDCGAETAIRRIMVFKGLRNIKRRVQFFLRQWSNLRSVEIHQCGDNRA